MPKTNLFGHVRASAQVSPNNWIANNESFWSHSGFSPIWSQQPECRKRIFLGTFRLQPKLVRTAGLPKRNVFGHIRASGQFGPNRAPPSHPPHPPIRAPPTRAPRTHPATHPPGIHECFGALSASAHSGPNSRNAKNESFWAHSGFSPIWSEQPDCQKRIFLGTFGLQPNLVRTTGMPKTNLFGHIRASAQFGPNRAPPTHPPTHPSGRHECFWAHSGFSPIWSEQPECPKTNVFGHLRALGQFGPNRAPPTHPPTHPYGRHECFWAHSCFSPIWSAQPGTPKTNLFGHVRASAQFGPNSRNTKNESFWAHSSFGPIWSEQRECQKLMFLGTFGLQADSVQTGHHPPTHPPGRHPPGRHPPHPPGRNESFWARSGFSPIWSEQPECQKRIFLGTFGLQPNLVRTAGMPKRNVFGHVPASGQFGPNRAPPTRPPTHPPRRHPPGRHPPTHPPTHPGATNVFGHIPASARFGPNSRKAKNESFWAHSGFSLIWSEQPERLKRIFFGHIRASAQFGPNGAPPTHPPTHPPRRHECFWAHSGFSPIWSEQLECQK